MATEQAEQKIAERVELGGLPLAAASDREIEDLAARARAELRSRKNWRRRVPIMERKHRRLLDKIRRLSQDAQALDQSIQAVKEGKGPGSDAIAGGPRRGMSPETRAKIGAARRRTLAQKKREAAE